MGGDPETDQRSRDFSRELGRLYVSTRTLSFEDYEVAMLELQARWLPLPSWTAEDGMEIARRVAEEILMGAYVRNVEWSHFSRSLERIRTLGFSNEERR